MTHKRSKRQSMVGGNAMLAPAISATPAEDDEEPMEVDQNDDLNISDDEDGGTRIGDIYIPPPVKPYCSRESIGPRLIITKITNNNFKSYAGEVTLGPFFNRFHAIIGPNGSGKSNVIDSMLFVFGYRSTKIRCKKLSVLLHNSSKHTNVCSCRVAVHFVQIIDKADGTYDIVPNTDFYIARTAFKDNSSFYTIGEKRVHFKEVAKLLKSHNVDLDHNRFLILQGEVESIAMMKAKAQTPNECGLLEYLEDIIGTSRYKEPLLQINNRVESLTEERTDKHNRCKLAEREMNDLKQPMEQAVEYLQNENELTRTKNLHIQKYLSEQNKNLRELEVDQVQLKEQLKLHDDLIKQMQTDRRAKEETIKKEIEQHKQLHRQKEELSAKLKKALNDYTDIHTSMDVTNKRRKQLKTQLKKEEDQVVEFKKVPEKNAAEIAECEKKIEKITNQKKEKEELLQANLETLQSEIQPLIDQKVAFQTQLIDLQKDVDGSRAALQLSESELKICKENETTEQRKYETLKSALDDARGSYEEKTSMMREHETSIPQLQAELTQKRQELDKNKRDEQKLAATIQTQRTDIEEKTRSMQASRSNNKVLDSLMRQKLEGNIPGILGRLGDLGGIDAKYDVAISTCCGRLENIVVDTVNTAQMCIEYLKRSDIGRATFIALEKVAHYSEKASQRIQTPENVPRIFDLIRVEDSRILAAFYFALHDTLVASDLEQSTRVAYGARRYRVVSLNGDMIEMSGTMSGGGRTQMRGRMGTTVKTKTAVEPSRKSNVSVVADLERKRVELQELETQLCYLQEMQGQLERDIQKTEQTIRQRENELKRMRLDFANLEKQLPRLKENVEQQRRKRDETHADPERVRELEVIIAENRKVVAKSEKAAKKITDQVDVVQEKVKEITGAKVSSIERIIDDFTKQMNKLSKNVAKLKVDVSASERAVGKAETKIADMVQEIKNAEESLVKGSELRKAADDAATAYKEQISDKQKEIDVAQKDSSSIQKEVDALNQQENDEKLKRVESDEKVRVITKKITDIQNQLPHWTNKLEPLKLNAIPNEDEQQPLKQYTEEELATYKLSDLQYKISVQEETLKSNKPNLSVIAEYFKKREVYLERVQVLEDITKKRNEMRQLHDDVRKKRYTEFIQGFNIITRQLKEMYQMITQGGDAELELVDSMDPFSEGVAFSVRPPKKSWKNISNLSGGEKTLSSLALVFALHYYKPSPLYFMDEIDAALDFRNVSIVANYIKARTKNAQFIIISLRSNMFELADFLTGIYKVEDCTNSVTLENDVPADMLPTSQSNTQMLRATVNENPKLSQFVERVDTQQSNDLFDTVFGTQSQRPAVDVASVAAPASEAIPTIFDENLNDDININVTVETSLVVNGNVEDAPMAKEGTDVANGNQS